MPNNETPFGVESPAQGVNLPHVPGCLGHTEIEHKLIRDYGLACAKAVADAKDARIAELEGIRPELPPYPPEGAGLPRYGLRWNGPASPLAVPMDDSGYWTPWHLARTLQQRVGELEKELAQVSGYCETLTQRCVDDTAENGELRRQLEAKGADAERWKLVSRLYWFQAAFCGRFSVAEPVTMAGIEAAADAASATRKGDATTKRNLEEEDAVANSIRASMGQPPLDFGLIRATIAARSAQATAGADQQQAGGESND